VPDTQRHPNAPAPADVLKPIATVHLPAICDLTDEVMQEPGIPHDNARAFLMDLRHKYHVVIVTAIANTWAGNRLMLRWLQTNELPYDEVWTGNGYPLAAVTHASKS
jgi:hypothetical protein